MKKYFYNIILYILAVLLFFSVLVRFYLIRQINLIEIIHNSRTILLIVVIINFIIYTWKNIFINLFTLTILCFLTIIELVLELRLGKNFRQIQFFPIFLILVLSILFIEIKKILKEFCIEENVYILSQKKKYRTAIFIYNILIKNNPTRTDLIYSRGSIYDEIGKYKKAEKDFYKSINSENPDARGFVALGIYKYENGENEKALELLQKGIEMDSTLKEYIPKAMKCKITYNKDSPPTDQL